MRSKLKLGLKLNYMIETSARVITFCYLTLAANRAFRSRMLCKEQSEAADILSGTPTTERRPFPTGRFFIAGHGPLLVGTQMRIFPTWPFGPAPFVPCVSFPNGGTDAPTVLRRPQKRDATSIFRLTPSLPSLFLFSLSPFPATCGNHLEYTAAPPKKENDEELCAYD